jgi:hypothetical protein
VEDGVEYKEYLGAMVERYKWIIGECRVPPADSLSTTTVTRIIHSIPLDPLSDWNYSIELLDHFFSTALFCPALHGSTVFLFDLELYPPIQPCQAGVCWTLSSSSMSPRQLL